MTHEEALAALAGRPTVAVVRSSLRSVKELHTRCLEHDVPATMARPPSGST